MKPDCNKCKRKIYLFDDIYSCNYCSTPEWNKFFRIAQNQTEIRKILIWFDKNILRQIRWKSAEFETRNKITLDVRIRVVCGMINKTTKLTRPLKQELMELIWSKYRESMREHGDFIAKSIFKVPF